jgi:hypothetical protein
MTNLFDCLMISPYTLLVKDKHILELTASLILDLRVYTYKLRVTLI